MKPAINRLFSIRSPYFVMDGCCLFACRPTGGGLYLGIGQLADGEVRPLLDVMLYNGGVRVRKRMAIPDSGDWEIPAEMKQAAPRSPGPLPIGAERLRPWLMPAADSKALYPYRVLSCLLPLSSSLAEYFEKREALAHLQRPADTGRDSGLAFRLAELDGDLAEICQELGLSLSRLKLLYRALCRWSRKHDGAPFPMEQHAAQICRYLQMNVEGDNR